MRLKVSPKDMIIFSVFCVFLLYFSAIASLNLLTLINDGEFFGFNPFPAFTGKYIFVTLLIFFSVLVAIFASVSSSIFERSSGFGLDLKEKEEKGYSRWLKEKEMKKAYNIYKVGVQDSDATVGGVVFINDGKNMWVDNSENHTLVIGVTGSGKTTAVVDPLIYSLCKHGESMVMTDPKGEIYKNHAELLKAKGYKIIVLNFRQPSMGNSWNPLTLPYQLYKAGDTDKAKELVDDVSQNIAADPKAQDPFWGNSSADYFSGCTLGLFEDAKEEEININSISLMTTVGEERFGAGSNYIKEYFLLKGESSSAYTFASNTINSPNETKGGILAVFRQKIRLFASREQLSEMLAYSDFDMRDIGREKTAVFMVIHDEKTTYHALATIFIKQCYETLISVAQESPGGKLPYRTNFILDEFANMPQLKDVTTMVTAARSRAIRFTFIIQNFAQLNSVYGKEDAETIRSNCGNLMYLLTTELAALEEISKLCGEVKSKKDDKTASQPLISVSDLQKLKMNEVIILRNRMHPFRTKLKQGFDTDWGDKEFGKAEFVKREPREIQLFDVINFVKLRKKSKMGSDKGPLKPDFANIMGGGMNAMGGGMNAMGGGTPPRIPTFEEFMAARNQQKAEQSNKAQPSFNVDELVKKIDAKIAELEAEEAKEKEKEENKAIEPTLPKPPVDNVSAVNEIKVEKDIASSADGGKGFNPFINKEVVNSVPFEEKNQVKENIAVTNNNVNTIKTFEDLMKQNDMPQNKPQIMVENKIEPAVDKKLTGIEDPTKTTAVNKVAEIPTNVNEETKVNLDTSSKVVNDVSDDAFFDDFFDE